MRMIVMLLCASAAVVRADPKAERAAVDKVAAMYAPIESARGAARVAAACASKVLDQVTALGASVPAGAAIDLAAYTQARDTVLQDLGSLAEACRAPDHTYAMGRDRKPLDDAFFTSLAAEVGALVGASRPRALPAALAKLRATHGATRFPSKQFCAQIATMTAQAAAIGAAPPGADAAKWQAALAAVTGDLAALNCTKQPAADEEIGSGLHSLATDLAALALAVPPVAPGDFYQGAVCHAVVDKVKACLADRAFIAALDAHAPAAQKQRNARLRAQVKTEWPADARDICGTYLGFTFQYEGFTDHPERLTIDAAASCASVGAAVRDAGGLPGGKVAK